MKLFKSFRSFQIPLKGLCSIELHEKWEMVQKLCDMKIRDLYYANNSGLIIAKMVFFQWLLCYRLDSVYSQSIRLCSIHRLSNI